METIPWTTREAAGASKQGAPAALKRSVDAVAILFRGFTGHQADSPIIGAIIAQK